VVAYRSAADSVLDALGDPSRRAVLDRLRRRPMAVGELAAGLPISRPAVSQHLCVLKAAGLVTDHPDGTRHIYRLDPSGLAAVQAYLEGFWTDVLAEFAQAVDGPPSRRKGRS
jgi:DNA-binding transcriptional ArsR family regulator